MGIWQDTSGHLFRIVVSRFAAAEAITNRGGSGHEIQGWHYELFLTDVPADAWPAQEVVRLYYDRCGQENRFAMLNHRYNLGRIFSFHKPGQALATLVALLVWNVEVLLGAEALEPWDEEHPDLRPKPRNDIPVPPPEPGVEKTDAEDTAPSSEEQFSEPGATTIVATEADSSTASDLELTTEPSVPSNIEAIEQALSLKRQDWITKHPGWTEHSSTLVCPAGTLLTSSLLDSNDTSISIRFRAPASACCGCSLRGDCASSVKTLGFRKEIQLRAKVVRVTDEDLAALTFYRRVVSIAPPRIAATTNGAEALQCAVRFFHPGPYACRMARLCIGELLCLHDESSLHSKYAIKVQIPKETPAPLPPAIAPTPAQRQRRRKTFAERIAWNDLPSGSTVRLLIIRLELPLDDSHNASVGKAA